MKITIKSKKQSELDLMHKAYDDLQKGSSVESLRSLEKENRNLQNRNAKLAQLVKEYSISEYIENRLEYNQSIAIYDKKIKLYEKRIQDLENDKKELFKVLQAIDVSEK